MKAKCTRGFGIVEDPQTGEEINVEGIFEVSEAVFKRLDDAYPGMETVDSTDETTDSDTDDESQESYADMDYAELRQLAADADTDEINGRSSKDEIIAFFEE